MNAVISFSSWPIFYISPTVQIFIDFFYFSFVSLEVFNMNICLFLHQENISIMQSSL